MSFLDKDYIEQNDVVQRYFHGKLTAEELIEFEKYMLLNPEIMEELEIAHAFKSTFEAMEAKEKVARSPKPHTKNSWYWPFGGFLVGAAATWLFVAPFTTVAPLTDSFVSPEVVYIDTMRGVTTNDDGATETLVGKNSAGQVLVIDMSSSSTTASAYSLVLRDTTGTILQQWKDVAQNERGELIVTTELAKYEVESPILEITSKDSNEVVLKTKLLME